MKIYKDIYPAPFQNPESDSVGWRRSFFCVNQYSVKKRCWIYKFNIFKDKKIICAVSTRYFGSIKTKNKINKKNLGKFTKVLGINAKNILFPNQAHGSKIRFVKNSDTCFAPTDGLVTDKKNLFLGVVTADCLPICFWDSKKSLVGIIHAGYKGILKGIIEELFNSFKSLGSNIGNIKIAICPAIGACCYSVSFDRIKLFTDKYPNLKTYQKKDGEYFLDLKNIVLQILTKEGIKKNKIEIAPLCTKCNIQTFFSYRGDTKETFGEFATVIGMI